MRRRLQLIVQLLPIRVGAILNHSLTNLVAPLEVYAPGWGPLIVLLVSHPWWLSRDDLLIVQMIQVIQVIHSIADAHHAVDGVQVLGMSWLENLLRPLWTDVNVVDAGWWTDDNWSALHLVV